MYISRQFCQTTNPLSTSCYQNVCTLPALPSNKLIQCCYQNVCILPVLPNNKPIQCCYHYVYILPVLLNNKPIQYQLFSECMHPTSSAKTKPVQCWLLSKCMFLAEKKKKKQKVVKNVQKWQTWCYMRILSSMAICKILKEMKSLILSFAKFFQYKCKINTLFSCICQTTDLKT